MKHKVLYIVLAVLALAVAVPLATSVLAQTPTPTPAPTPTPQVPAPGPRFHGGQLGRGGLLSDWQTLKRVSTLLKLTPEEIYTHLDSGQTLAAIAQAQGVTVTDVANTILAPSKDQLQLRVKYSYITQEQADYTLFVQTKALEKRLGQPLRISLPGTTGGRGSTGMMGPRGPDGQGKGPGGMMGPQGMGSTGMGGGMMDGGMMGGGSGLTW